MPAREDSCVVLGKFEHQLGHNEPDLLNDKKKLAKRKKEETETIKKSLRLNYVIDEWGREHEISATKEEVQQRFYMQAYMMQQNPSELVNSPYGETLLYQIEQQILATKVLENVCNKVLGKDGKPSADAGAADESGVEAAADLEKGSGEPSTGEDGKDSAAPQK